MVEQLPQDSENGEAVSWKQSLSLRYHEHIHRDCLIIEAVSALSSEIPVARTH